MNSLLAHSIRLLCLAALVVAADTRPVGAQPARPELEGRTVLEAIGVRGRTLVTFRADYSQDLTPDAVVELAQKMGEKLGKAFDMERLKETGDHRLGLPDPEDPSGLFEIDTRSGSILFNRGLAKYRQEQDTPDLLTPDEAYDRAIQYLDDMELRPEEEQLVARKVGGLDMAVRLDDGTTRTYKKLVTVRFGRRLGGFPVFGDSRIVIHLGAKGELAGLVHQWPSVERLAIQREELRPDEVLREAVEDRLRAGAARARRIVLKRAAVVMYDDGQGAIEPAYHVEAQLYYELQGAGDQPARYDVPFDFYVPILKTPRAFYPFMETAGVRPTDGRRTRVAPNDDSNEQSMP